MHWEYTLLGVAIGIFFGALAMRFGHNSLRQQKNCDLPWISVILS